MSTKTLLTRASHDTEESDITTATNQSVKTGGEVTMLPIYEAESESSIAVDDIVFSPCVRFPYVLTFGERRLDPFGLWMKREDNGSDLSIPEEESNI